MKLNNIKTTTYKNAVGLVKFIKLSLIYEKLRSPVEFLIYPHQFETWDDFEKLKQDKVSRGHRIAVEQYTLQDLNDNQISLLLK